MTQTTEHPHVSSIVLGALLALISNILWVIVMIGVGAFLLLAFLATYVYDCLCGTTYSQGVKAFIANLVGNLVAHG